MWQAADLGGCHGGIMSIKRSVIVPAILALSAVGSIAAGTVAPVVAAQAASAHVVAAAPDTLYHL
jgi:hypothetical protein